MVKIITIHGTNAGAESDHGDEWWQKGSDFQTKLEARLAERGVGAVRFEPFHWSGANSELARRRAGARLADKLEKEDEPALLIGHSHGGSVALHALFYKFISSPKKAFEHIRSLITVGTPMIRYRASWNPIFRFNIFGQLFLLYAILIGAFAIFEIFFADAFEDLTPLIGESILSPFIATREGVLGAIAQIFTPAVILASVVPIIILTVYARRSARRNRTFASNAMAREFADIYAPINHSQDEAIAALKTGVGLNMRIADRRTVRAALFAPLALFFAATLITRTVSETVDIAEVRDFFLPSEDAAAERTIGVAPLGIRDAASRLRALSGELRDSKTEKPTLLRQSVVFARDDYVVMDLATAIRTRHRDSLVGYLEGLGPKAVSRLVNRGGEYGCAREAVYLTREAQQALILAAKALPEKEYGPPPARAAMAKARAYRDNMYGRALKAQDERCLAADVAFAGQGSAIEDLIAAGALIEVARGALYSHRPEISEILSVAQAEIAGPMRLKADGAATLVYPEIRAGEAVVFERSSFNDAQVDCFAASGWALVSRFAGFLGEKPGRYISVEGFCRQFEGGTFTLYDFSTTFLAEIEGLLLRGVAKIGRTVDDLVRDTDGAEIISVSDYLGDNRVRAGVLAPIIFVFTIVSVAWLSAAALSFFFAPLLSGIFNTLIKNSIFGNDGEGETVRQVAPGLDFAASEVGTLPAAVEEDIVTYVGQYAPKTLERLREIISLSSLARDGQLPLPEMAENLTWKELIHTAYFDVDSFVDHMADVIVEKARL